MSIIVNNTDNQLNINNNGVLDVYAVRSIKSVSKGVDASGNYYIAINFIANDKNNSLRIYLKDVSSPVTWTNNLAGANAALADIRDWLAEIVEVDIDAANDSIGIYGYNGSTPTPVFVNANGQVAVQGLYGEDSAHSSTNSGMFVMGVRNDSNTAMTNANGDYSPIAVNANGAVAVNDGGNSITVDGGTGVQRTATFLRPSGSNGTVGPNIYSASFASVGTANAIVGGINLKPGETLNFDAGAINNTLAAITYNTLTNAGAELIIITLT
jgi:hypothetical protein